MQTRFDVGDEVFIKAKVHNIKLYKSHSGEVKEKYSLEIPGGVIDIVDESHITDKHEIIDGYVNESIIKKIENSEPKYPEMLNCCCDMNPKGGI